VKLKSSSERKLVVAIEEIFGDGDRNIAYALVGFPAQFGVWNAPVWCKRMLT
jgi:hypothetical protein